MVCTAFDLRQRCELPEFATDILERLNSLNVQGVGCSARYVSLASLASCKSVQPAAAVQYMKVVCEDVSVVPALQIMEASWAPLDCLAWRDIPCLACASVVLYSYLCCRCFTHDSGVSTEKTQMMGVSTKKTQMMMSVHALPVCVLRMIW